VFYQNKLLKVLCDRINTSIVFQECSVDNNRKI